MCRFSCGKPFLSLPCCQELTWRAASYTKASLLHSAVAAAAWSNLSAASLCPFLHFTFKSWRSRLIWSLKGQNQWEQVACPETDWFCCQPVWPLLPPPPTRPCLALALKPRGSDWRLFSPLSSHSSHINRVWRTLGQSITQEYLFLLELG